MDNTHIYTCCVCVRGCVKMYIYTYMYIYGQCTYIHVYYTQAYMYTYIYMYIHITYIHTRKLDHTNKYICT